MAAVHENAKKAVHRVSDRPRERIQQTTLEMHVQAVATLAALTVALSAWCNRTAPSSCVSQSIVLFEPCVPAQKPVPEPTGQSGSLLFLCPGGAATTTQRHTGF